MSEELKNILNPSNNDIDNQKLMAYLAQQLSAKDTHEVEKIMSDDEFMNDAVEGLQQFNSTKKLPHSVNKLNQNLKKLVAKNKSHKQKRKIKNTPSWVYFTIIILLLLIIIAYVVIKKQSYSNNKSGGKKIEKIQVANKIFETHFV